MSQSRKLDSYLDLAEEVRSLASHIPNEMSERLRVGQQRVGFRDRVLIGLAVKMNNSFECLRKDAEEGRLEAMHHLKTLVETFIYFHWTARDTGEDSARLLYARTINETVRFYEKNPGYVEKYILDEWVKELASAIRGVETKWQKFKKRKIEHLAGDVGIELGGWYNRIYRLACGPAHVSDLIEHMPGSTGEIRLGKTPISHLRAEIALDYGLHIMWGVLRMASEYLSLGLEARIDSLQSRHNVLRMLPAM